jgi:hypothetical protein
VADHIEEIRDIEHFEIPLSANEEISIIGHHLSGSI